MGESAGGKSGSAPRYLTTLLEVGTTTGLTDGQLLDRFLDRRDESAEAAFAALLERHGGMVRRVCREVLGNAHDADDAFQAVFLILAKNAGSIRRRGSAGPWLHGVALRVARCARSSAARRRRHERRRGEMIGSSGLDGGVGRPAPSANPVDPEVGRALHEEIGRLADKHRSPVVLCYLEGLTHEMAARQLGWPVGTVRSRLAWARERLRGRLTRRGFAPSLIPAGLASASKVPISSALTEATLRAAMRIGSGGPALAGIASAPVVTLVEEGLRAMFWTKLKLLAATTLAAGAITTGAGVAAYSYRQEQAVPREPAGDQDRAAAPAQDVQEEPIDSRMERLLKLWEGRSQKLKSLEVKFYRRDVDSRDVLGGEEHYQGTAKFESPNLAYIEFNLIKLDRNKKAVVDPETKRRATLSREQIKYTGNEVWLYKSDTKQIFVFPLNKEEQERVFNGGLFLFLFKMKADNARNRYEMTLLPDQAGSKVHQIKVKPKLAVDREDSGEALIELEKRYLLPTRILLISPDQKRSSEYFLSHHVANPSPPIDRKFFQGTEIKGWQDVRFPEANHPNNQAKGGLNAISKFLTRPGWWLEVTRP
jgi:RNA polymerase sigma factor (sigma-70 family)